MTREVAIRYPANLADYAKVVMPEEKEDCVLADIGDIDPDDPESEFDITVGLIYLPLSHLETAEANGWALHSDKDGVRIYVERK